MITRMDHFTVMTDRLAETLDFYARLGLTAGPRPDFGVGGAWLYVGDHPVLHGAYHVHARRSPPDQLGGGPPGGHHRPAPRTVGPDQHDGRLVVHDALVRVADDGVGGPQVDAELDHLLLQ